MKMSNFSGDVFHRRALIYDNLKICLRFEERCYSMWVVIMLTNNYYFFMI